MNLLGNIIWLIFGGFAAAFEYFVTGILWCLSIVGIPFGVQCFKLGLLMLFPFGTQVGESNPSVLGCAGNVVWFLLGGFLISLTHIFFGALLCLTIIGIPFGRMHFRFAKLAFNPFGRDLVSK